MSTNFLLNVAFLKFFSSIIYIPFCNKNDQTIIKNYYLFKLFQIFSKFTGTGSHPKLPFTPKSVAFR